MIKTLRYILMGIHFVLAGLANLALCMARPFHPNNSHWVARIYSAPALRILGLKLQLDTESLQDLSHPAVMVCNHQSNFDLFVVGAAVPQRTVTVGKKSLKWVPFFGQIFWLGGNVLIDRGNGPKAKQAMLKTTDILQNKNTNIWIFAEGTRNKGKGLLPFKKGAFKMAIDSQVDIVLVCVSSYKRDMDLSKVQSGQAIIRSLPPISTAGLGVDDIPSLIERCHVQMSKCIDELDLEIRQGFHAQF